MNRPKSRLALAVCFLLLVLLATGCWGRRETDELGYVLAIGIDKGQRNLVKLTFQIAIPTALASGGGGGGGDEATEVISVEAASIFGALQLANSFSDKELTFIHNELVIVSSEIAKEGLDRYINPIIRSREVRRNVTISVTPGSAAEFLKANKPKLEKNPAIQFELLMSGQGYTGFILDTTLNEFNKRAKSPGSAPVLTLLGVNKGEAGGKPTAEQKSLTELVRTEVSYLPGEIPREGGNKIEVIGLAAFKEDRLVGFLNGGETRYFAMITDKFSRAMMTFPDYQSEGDVVIVRVSRGRSPEIKVDISGDSPVISIKLVLEGEFVSIQSGIEYEGGPQEKELERYLEEYISREAAKVIKKAQEEFKSDIFGLGEGTRRFFWTWDDWLNYDWPPKYRQAEIKVETSLDIRRTGLMLKTEPIPRGGN